MNIKKILLMERYFYLKNNIKLLFDNIINKIYQNIELDFLIIPSLLQINIINLFQYCLNKVYYQLKIFYLNNA